VFRDGTKIGTATGTTYADTTVSAGTTYGYAVAAVDSQGTVGALSTSVSATTPAPPTPPGAVGNLVATATSGTRVTLTWNAATAGTNAVAGYQISRGGTLLTTVPGTTYVDNSVAPSTAYTYTVTAVDSANLTGPPTSASVTTPAAPVTNLIPNPGFETWSGGVPTGWVSYGGATTKFTQSSTSPHSGSSVVDVSTTNANYAAAGATYQPASVTTGRTYSASCWVRSNVSITVTLQQKEYTSSWGTPVGSPTSNTIALKLGDNVWHQLSVTYTVLKTGDILNLTAYSTNLKTGSGSFQVDDCSLS
jgi:hypothetical protein